MESALIVSTTEKGLTFFTDMLKALSCDKIATATSCGDARRQVLERDFDLCIINAPLRDETGEALSRHIATRGISQVILCVKNEYFGEISAVVEDYGVITISKPINKTLFWNALKMAKAAFSKMTVLQAENSRLTQKIEDIRAVSRAKCVLISYLNMSESEAHKHIEKLAMDMRITRRKVAEEILKTYES